MLQRIKSNKTIRRYIQAAFLLFNIYIGIRFYFFYRYYDSGRTTFFVSRPSSVEAYLPINALISLKYWLTTGVFDSVHPAGLVIFIAVIITTLLFGRAFCSWICPVGAISEYSHKIGGKIGINIKPHKFIDIPLRSLKYLLLLFFVFAIMQMDSFALRGFLASPYSKIVDVKMLLFFLNLSSTAVLVLLILFILSLMINNFWCRYLCPYGALLGICSKAGAVKVRRNQDSCTNCLKCEKACPSYIKITKKRSVNSVECIQCLDCVNACPVPDTLEEKMLVHKQKISPKKYALILMSVFFAIILIAQLTGHWQTSISQNEYSRRIPEINSPQYSHF